MCMNAHISPNVIFAHTSVHRHTLTVRRLILWNFSKRIIDECSFSELLITCFYSITSLERLSLSERKRQIGFAECAKPLLW